MVGARDSAGECVSGGTDGGRKNTAPRAGATKDIGESLLQGGPLRLDDVVCASLVIYDVEASPSLAALPLQPPPQPRRPRSCPSTLSPEVASPAQRTWICPLSSPPPPPISKLLHTAPANGPWRGPLLHIAAPALPSSRRQLASSMTAVDKGWAANAASCRSFPSGGTSRRHMHRQPPQYPGSRLQWKTGGADAGCGASSRHQQHNSSFSRHLWRWRA